MIVTTEVEELINRIDSLAAQKPVAIRIISACDSPTTDASSLANLVQLDVSIASRLLKLSNSAYYGLGSRVTTVQRSISLLGFSAVRAMSAIVLSGSDDESLPPYFAKNAQLVATAAKELSAKVKLKPSEMFCLGLVSCVGEALLWHHDNTYFDLIEENRDKWSRNDRLSAENERYGIDHVALAHTALTHWNFPSAMVDAISFVGVPSSMNAPSLVLRSAMEIARRVNEEPNESARTLTGGRFSDEDFDSIMRTVRAQVTLGW